MSCVELWTRLTTAPPHPLLTLLHIRCRSYVGGEGPEHIGQVRVSIIFYNYWGLAWGGFRGWGPVVSRDPCGPPFLSVRLVLLGLGLVSLKDPQALQILAQNVTDIQYVTLSTDLQLALCLGAATFMSTDNPRWPLALSSGACYKALP